MTLRRFISIMGISLAALAGCNGVVHNGGTPFNSPDLIDALCKKTAEMYPVGMRATHRAILTTRGRESALTGVVHSKPDGTIRLAGISDLGRTVFCVSRWPDGKATVERRLPVLSDSALINGPLRDVEAIYFRRPPKNAILEQRDGGLVSLVSGKGSGRREEFLFDASSQRLVGYYLVRGSRCVYKIQYADYGMFPGWSRPTPRTITITDYCLKYDVRVTLTKMECVADADRDALEKR
jgi:hypothetical protein